MRRHTPAAVLLVALVLAPAPATPGAAADSAARSAERPARPTVTVTVPDAVVEGDRFVVEARVARTKDARRILLQQWTTDVLGDSSWRTVKRKRVAGTKRHTFGAVAGTDDTQRYRVRVLYRDAEPAMSRPVSTTVWHWVPLTSLPDHDETPGVLDGGSGNINGVRYNGLFTYGSGSSSWEIRYTLGRHCRALRGVLGVTDDSADGSSAVISVVSDETSPVLTSGVLVPGMDQRFQVDLPLPYRLSVRMQETSAADQAAFPAIGAPDVLCTGLP